MSAVTYCSAPLYENRRRISWPIGARFENVLHHFGKPCVFKFTSRHYISSGVYNSASSSDAMFGKKDVTYLLTYAHNQSRTEFLLVNGRHAMHFISTLRSCVLSFVRRRNGRLKPRTKYVLHFAIVNESAAMVEHLAWL